MAEAPERCLLCPNTDNSTSTDTDTEQGVNSSTSKNLYPKIHFCGNIIWICSTCPIKGRQCNHCKEDLLESHVVTKENLTHVHLFTDLTMAEERENRVIFQNEIKYCKNHTVVPAVSFCPQCECMFLCQECSKNHRMKKKEKETEGIKECKKNERKYHIVKHIEQIKKCTQNKKSSPCVVHTDTESDVFCRTHSVPVCLDCRGLYHKTCNVDRFTDSLEETRKELEKIIKKLERKEKYFERHFQRIKDQKEVINKILTEEFNQVRLWIDGLENELKTSVEDEYEKQHKIIQRQKVRVPVHQRLIERVLYSPPDAAFFDMTQTLEAIVNRIKKDISELKDVNMQMKFQERREDLEQAFKNLAARMIEVKFGSRRSSYSNGMGTTSSNNATLYSSALSVSGPRGSINITEPGMSHETENVVYVYTCTKCHKLYVGQTKKKLKDRDCRHRSSKNSEVSIYKHKCIEDEQDGETEQFVVSCLRKDLVHEEERCIMETLIMLKLGTLEPSGINKQLPRNVLKSLEILRFQTLNGADVELRNDDRTAIIKESNGINSLVLSREVLFLKRKKSYEVLLEEINNENVQFGIGLNQRWIPVPIKLPTCTMPCRLGIDFYKQFGVLYFNGKRISSITLQGDFKAKKYWAVFSACSKITGLPILPQKTWRFAKDAKDAGLKLSDKGKTIECESEGYILSENSMKCDILYEVNVDQLYGDKNRDSHLGILIKRQSTEYVFPINLTEGCRCGVIVDAQKNLRLFWDSKHTSILQKCVTLPCYFYLKSKGLKVSTLPETRVFFDQDETIA